MLKANERILVPCVALNHCLNVMLGNIVFIQQWFGRNTDGIFPIVSCLLKLNLLIID